MQKITNFQKINEDTSSKVDSLIASCSEHLDKIKTYLDEYKEKNASINYSDVGSLGYVLNELKQITEFINT